MLLTSCCSSLISSSLSERNGTRRSAGGMYSQKELNDCNSETRQICVYLDERVVTLVEILAKTCPRPASKSDKKTQMRARGHQ